MKRRGKGEEKMKDLKERVEECQRNTFDFKMEELEGLALSILACVKNLRSTFLLYKEKQMTAADVEDAVRDLADEIKFLYEVHGSDLDAWIRSILKVDEQHGDEYGDE